LSTTYFSPYAEHALAAPTPPWPRTGATLRLQPKATQTLPPFGRRSVLFPKGFALLGQGRCLTQLGRTSDATSVLHQAREIFTRLQAAPALAEVDQLLQEATALSS
jgi:hypothetical protein